MQFRFGDHILDTDRRELRRGSEPVAIDPQVFDVSVYLLQNRDRVLSRDEFTAAVWGGRIVSDSNLTSRLPIRVASQPDRKSPQLAETSMLGPLIAIVGDANPIRIATMRTFQSIYGNEFEHRSSSLKLRTPWERKGVRAFMLIPVFGPNSGRLPSRFGQGAGVP